MQSMSSPSSSTIDPLSTLVNYVDTLSDQSIQLKDIRWALDLPCALPVLNFLAELIASENDGIAERTAGLEREERETWDRAVQVGLVNAEPSEETTLDLSRPYLTPTQLSELTAYNKRTISTKDRQLRHVQARAQILKETHDQISGEINESRKACARLDEKIRQAEASLLEFSVKMNHVLIPQLTAQLFSYRNPAPLQNEVNLLLDNLSIDLPTLPSFPTSQASSISLSPSIIEEEALRLSDSLRSLLHQEDTSKESLNSKKERIWEREMEDVLSRMDDGDFGSEDEDEDEDEWEAESQEPRPSERKPMALIKDLVEGAWEWDMMNELENSIEKARNAKTVLIDIQLPVLLLLQTTLQAESDQALDSLAIWQAIHLEIISLRSEKIALNPKRMDSAAQPSDEAEEGFKWKESMRTILRSSLTTSTLFKSNKTVPLASYDDVLIYLHSLKAHVCRLKTQADEELDKLIRGGTFRSQRILSTAISSDKPTPLHPSLEPPKEVQQAKDNIQKMMKTVEGLVKEWIVLGESLGKNKEGRKQISKFVGEYTALT